MKPTYILLLSFVFFRSFAGLAQNDCTLESYYSNPDFFTVDTVYQKVAIDGQNFVIKVLHDKKDEYLEPVEESDEYDFSSPSPITLVFYTFDDRKMVYAKKFGYELPYFFKAGGNLYDQEKLYLGWLDSGGGSGFSEDIYHVLLKNGKIVMDGVLQGNELSYSFYNKNDKEIYLFQAIWDFTEEEIDSENFETHFSDHKYEITCYRYGYHGYEKALLGITKGKYASEWDDAKDLLREIQQKESLLPIGFDTADYY